MKKYCYVKNGSVAATEQNLPVNFENVSNFYLLDDANLKHYGWLPYEKISDNKEIFVSSSYEILENKVVERCITRDKTKQELQDEANVKKNEQWDSVRAERNARLQESDKFVVSDKWEQMSVEAKQLWSEYRKALRDLPQNVTNPFDVNWPIQPK